MELTVFWTHFAEDKLDDIFHYYKLNVSSSFAHKLINEIVDKTTDLEKKCNDRG